MARRTGERGWRAAFCAAVVVEHADGGIRAAGNQGRIADRRPVWRDGAGARRTTATAADWPAPGRQHPEVAAIGLRCHAHAGVGRTRGAVAGATCWTLATGHAVALESRG